MRVESAIKRLPKARKEQLIGRRSLADALIKLARAGRRVRPERWKPA